MSEQAEAGSLLPIQINAQYVKDLSFEVPGAPQVFAELGGTQPELSVRVDLNAVPLGGNTFEVTLILAADAKVGEKVGFIVELTYGGIFQLSVPEEHVQPILLIEAPRLLFPFARSIIANVTSEGGLPPLMLQPIDFAALYRARLDHFANAEGGSEFPAGHA